MNYKDFSINDLMSFVTAYETHNISKCSEILFISRQSVARSISKIENVVGAELFHRSEKGVFPKGRYERYVHIFKELKEKERNRYK